MSADESAEENAFGFRQKLALAIVDLVIAELGGSPAGCPKIDNRSDRTTSTFGSAADLSIIVEDEIYNSRKIIFRLRNLK